MSDSKDYFTIDVKMLQKRNIFPFQLHIYNPHNKNYTAFLNANSPFIKEKKDFLDYILERNGKLAVLYKQKKTFLNAMGLTEEDVPSLRAKEDHPLEKNQQMYAKILEKKAEIDGTFIFQEAMIEATHENKFMPIIEQARDEILAFKVTISHTVSLARYFAEKLLDKDNLTNRIVAVSYFVAKSIDIIDEESLGDLICAAFMHHIGQTQLELPLCREAQLKLDSISKKQFKKHTGLSQHLIRKSQVDLSPRAINAIIEHHERFDGSGYPNNKVGSHIEPLALVLGAVSHILEYNQGLITGDTIPLQSIIRNLKDHTLTPGLEFTFGDTINENLITLLDKKYIKEAA